MTLPVRGGTPSSTFLPPCLHQAWNATSAFAVKAFKEIAQIAQDIKDNPNSVVKILKVAVFGIIGARHLTSNTALAEPFTNRIAKANGMIDVFNTVPDANYFVSGAYKQDNIADNIGNGLFLAADIGGLPFWLDELKVLELSKVSELIGKIPFIGQIPFSLSQALTGVVGTAFAFLGIGAVVRLVQAYRQNGLDSDKRQAWLDLAWSIAEVASKTFLLLGLAQVALYGTIGMIALGSAAAILGIASSVHGAYTERTKQCAVEVQRRRDARIARGNDQEIVDNAAAPQRQAQAV